MGREQKRKEIKKKQGTVSEIKEKKTKEKERTVKDEVYSFGRILLVVLVLLLGIYMIAEPFMRSISGKKDEKTEDTINAEHITASEIFKMKEEKYYVLAYDFENASSALEYTISSSQSGSTFYRVDIASPFNKNYVGDTSNKNATSLANLKISGMTLISIENGSVTHYIEGAESIISHLKG